MRIQMNRRRKSKGKFQRSRFIGVMYILIDDEMNSEERVRVLECSLSPQWQSNELFVFVFLPDGRQCKYCIIIIIIYRFSF